MPWSSSIPTNGFIMCRHPRLHLRFSLDEKTAVQHSSRFSDFVTPYDKERTRWPRQPNYCGTESGCLPLLPMAYGQPFICKECARIPSGLAAAPLLCNHNASQNAFDKRSA